MSTELPPRNLYREQMARSLAHHVARQEQPPMIRLLDLPENPRPGVMLYCPRCGSTYSATRGDYFWMPHTKVFRCQRDRGLLILVHERTVHDPITPTAAEQPPPPGPPKSPEAKP